MQIGMIGLGRMGSNMVRRLMQGGHECVVYNRSSDTTAEQDYLHNEAVFLLDADNTLLDNDCIMADLNDHLVQEFDDESRNRY